MLLLITLAGVTILGQPDCSHYYRFADENGSPVAALGVKVGASVFLEGEVRSVSWLEGGGPVGLDKIDINLTASELLSFDRNACASGVVWYSYTFEGRVAEFECRRIHLPDREDGLVIEGSVGGRSFAHLGLFSARGDFLGVTDSGATRAPRSVWRLIGGDEDFEALRERFSGQCS